MSPDRTLLLVTPRAAWQTIVRQTDTSTAEKLSRVGGTRRVDLSEALDTNDVAAVQYHLPPGAQFPSGLHAHADQSETFLVLTGSVVFETVTSGREHTPPPPEHTPPPGATVRSLPRDQQCHREVTVTAGEAVRFDPGEFQTGHNAADSPASVLAVGAPRETDDVRFPQSCPECDHPTVRLDTAGGLEFDCPNCRATHSPRSCPACEDSQMQFRLDESSVVVRCRSCQATVPDGIEREGR